MKRLTDSDPPAAVALQVENGSLPLELSQISPILQKRCRPPLRRGMSEFEAFVSFLIKNCTFIIWYDMCFHMPAIPRELCPVPRVHAPSPASHDRPLSSSDVHSDAEVVVQ